MGENIEQTRKLMFFVFFLVFTVILQNKKIIIVGNSESDHLQFGRNFAHSLIFYIHIHGYFEFFD